MSNGHSNCAHQGKMGWTNIALYRPGLNGLTGEITLSMENREINKTKIYIYQHTLAGFLA